MLRLRFKVIQIMIAGEGYVLWVKQNEGVDEDERYCFRAWIDER